MRAVHAGAGNIGRGFIGLLLAEAGFHVVFADVQAGLISRLQDADSFTVHEVGEGGRDHLISDFSAVNSQTEEDRLIAEIAGADVYTTAVGPRVLPFLVPALLSGLRARTTADPLVVMACENAIGATTQLRDALIAAAGEDWHDLSDRAVFADTAVDRIVPGQADGGLDVTVEAFSEWVIEAPPLGRHRPEIPGATFVDDLAPFIERKLFTVNTGHAATAYLGARTGRETIAEAIADPTIRAAVEQALEETSALIVAEHGVAVEEQDAYREKILGRFANPHLPDTVLRVGREPLRKLSRSERFIGPSARLAALGLPTAGLLAAVEAALAFDTPDDEQSVELQRLLIELDPESFTTQVTGLTDADALYPEVRSLVAAVQRRR